MMVQIHFGQIEALMLGVASYASLALFLTRALVSEFCHFFRRSPIHSGVQEHSHPLHLIVVVVISDLESILDNDTRAVPNSTNPDGRLVSAPTRRNVAAIQKKRLTKRRRKKGDSQKGVSTGQVNRR